MDYQAFREVMIEFKKIKTEKDIGHESLLNMDMFPDLEVIK